MRLGLAAAVAVVLLAVTQPAATAAEAPVVGPAWTASDLDYHWRGLPTWSQGYGPMRNLARQAYKNDDSLHYETRRYGINIGWTDWPRSQIYVYGEGLARDAPITPTTRVALYFPGGGYLKHGAREWGIGLVWSSTPVYEWLIEPAGSSGDQLVHNIGTPDASIDAYLAMGPDTGEGPMLRWGPGPVRY
ncbi:MULTISPECIES: hypothetical protein [unclassified Micromonospora]|uniref:hypothetical protein n=1 Tax=unclassified Micromonospora TaxID=2617518 RepID=UPI0022C397B0|nr:hypothetical protein [Micromonospora sp. AKA38]GHJ15932.1 hypothetical protein TPA0908_39270 [Micromonospora sp. AKA38]